ncbi:hypothetical protein CC78DRAFT_530812 [Lojkania enalia]|uniref:Cytochrome P450 n=1 Tax=Lojkania enalia TaxID=147567 RepID=A0A9P4KEW7_9PLEO|nr:hypothetical protein CC78DRAFT_530812 [Didymosphaeria enalia]
MHVSRKGYELPIQCAVAISMSIRDMHPDPTLFPSPHTFRPERWLGEQKVMNEKWFAAFGRGSRSCVGKNLAMAELLMGIGICSVGLRSRWKKVWGGEMLGWSMIALVPFRLGMPGVF